MRFLILVFLAACGGGAFTPTSDPLTDGQLADVCADYCAGDACWGDGEECLDRCFTVMGDWRGDAAVTFLDCLVEPCYADQDEICAVGAAMMIEPTAAYDAMIAACEDAAARCSTPDECGQGLQQLASDPVLAEMQACYELPCDEIDACLFS